MTLVIERPEVAAHIELPEPAAEPSEAPIADLSEAAEEILLPDFRRLNNKFIQRQRRRIGDRTIRGEIVRRQHSHNRAWGEKYGNYSPRHVLAISRFDPDVYEFNHFGDFESYDEEAEAQIANLKDFVLRLVNESLSKGFEEPTIGSVAGSKLPIINFY